MSVHRLECLLKCIYKSIDVGLDVDRTTIQNLSVRLLVLYAFFKIKIYSFLYYFVDVVVYFEYHLFERTLLLYSIGTFDLRYIVPGRS